MFDSELSFQKMLVLLRGSSWVGTVYTVPPILQYQIVLLQREAEDGEKAHNLPTLEEGEEPAEVTDTSQVLVISTQGTLTYFARF